MLRKATQPVSRGTPNPNPRAPLPELALGSAYCPNVLNFRGAGLENDYILSLERHGRCLEAAAAPRGSDGGRLCGSVQDEPTFCQEPLMTDSKSLD